MIRGPRPPSAKWTKGAAHSSKWSESAAGSSPAASSSRASGPRHCNVQRSRSSDEVGSRHGRYWRVRPCISRSPGRIEDGQGPSSIEASSGSHPRCRVIPRASPEESCGSSPERRESQGGGGQCGGQVGSRRRGSPQGRSTVSWLCSRRCSIRPPHFPLCPRILCRS